MTGSLSKLHISYVLIFILYYCDVLRLSSVLAQGKQKTESSTYANLNTASNKTADLRGHLTAWLTEQHISCSV